jgi:hypothetical protein
MDRENDGRKLKGPSHSRDADIERVTLDTVWLIAWAAKGRAGLFYGHFSCRQEMDSGWLHYQLRIALEQTWMIQCWRDNLAVRARNQTSGRLVMMSSLSSYSTLYKSRMVSLFELYHSFSFILVCVLWRSALSIRTRPGGR